MTNETQEQKRIENVQMTLEEATDLFDKGWFGTPKEDPKNYTENLFYNSQTYNFKPLSLSEITRKLQEYKLNKKNYRSYIDIYGTDELYLAKREKNGEIEIKSVRSIFESHWKKKSPKNFYIEGTLRQPQNNPRYQILVHQIFTYANFLDYEKMALSFEDSKSCVKLPGEKLTLREISNLPIWDSPNDYESFLKTVYSEERLNEMLRNGEKFNLLDVNTSLSNEWTLLTPILTDTAYTKQGLFVSLNSKLGPWNEVSEIIIPGTINLPKNSWKSLEGTLLNDYVNPKSIGNGVSVFSNDKIPLYLKRKLGIGWEK